MAPGALETQACPSTAPAPPKTASAFLLAGQPIATSSPSPYLHMTRAVIQSARDTYTVPPDWSSAAFPIALAAVAGSTQLTNLTARDPLQADCALLDILSQVGTHYRFTPNGLSVRRHHHHPLSWDFRLSPDLFPALVFLASYLHGTSTLTGLSGLQYKESNRLAECLDLLAAFEVKHHLHGDTLSICGGQPRQTPRSIQTARDHRLVMTAALFLQLNGGGSLRHPEEVEKSFPQFFIKMKTNC